MLKTEMRNPDSTHIDEMSTSEMVALISRENAKVISAIDAANAQITAVIDAVSDAIANGHRLIYVGAGTSGRLGILDAAECPPTFGVPYELVRGIIAGGENSVFRASENAEDKMENGRADIRGKVEAGDVVIGISAAGGAAYVIGAIREARELGAVTAAITNNPDTPITQEADLSIVLDTGAEVITGSTRMKAGTAQKIVLNMITTCAMVKTGKVYENLMINLKPTNKKLRDRVIRIVTDITALPYEESEKLLEQNDWNIRAAVDAFRKAQ